MTGKSASVTVELGELLDNVRAHVTVFLLDLLGSFERRVWFASVTKQRLDKIGDVASSDGDRLDRRADDVALCDGNDVRNTVSRINDSSGKRAIMDL